VQQIHQITNQEINEALAKNQIWDLGNKVLYDLCLLHPHHKTDEEIVAKVWLIGRSYAAAIERRKTVALDPTGDLFYEETVLPFIKTSPIDDWFDSLKEQATPENAIRIHFKLMTLFKEISGLDKRSLASKYLHFHFKDLFFIYDSRAMAAIRLATSDSKRQPHEFLPNESDPEYADFFQRCLWLKQDLRARCGCELSPRDLDKVLTYIADSEGIVPKQAQAHAGSLPGKIWLASDFEAPLDDFKDFTK
jgi:hypothetical protein